MQGLTLRQTGADEKRQSPQALSPCSATSGSWMTFQILVQDTLKSFVKVLVMLGGTQ